MTTATKMTALNAKITKMIATTYIQGLETNVSVYRYPRVVLPHIDYDYTIRISTTYVSAFVPCISIV